jgi:Tol biopolymer transport system component
MRRFSGLVALLLVCGAAQAAGQMYFGQNKVQYSKFEWQVIRTDHFEVYFYEREREAALDAARMAERGYARLSRILRHQFKVRKPIILYASASDFQQTNTTNDLGEGIGGFTEPLKHRMVLPFTGSYQELEHVLQHEMVHQFQFDVFSHGQIGGGLQALSTVQPPLWFMEGMAEYLSLGPPDALTMMWLRDAAIEGKLPTIQQMSFDPRIFPYHFGHALWAYVGEKWGDEAIGEILQASVSSGVEGAFRRALGRSLDDLSDEWRDAIQTTVLPQLADHYRARRIAKPLLTQRRSEGNLHLAAALSPDGKDVAFLSERSSFFIDLYLADGETGRVKRQLIKSTINSNFESLRFINSAGSFSQDGHLFAIAVKHKDRDDIVILDVSKDREVGRIRVPLNGVLSPAWSPDGKQIVFTGLDGGISDLFIVNRDGSDLRRLTNDKYADLMAAWSPDGKTIAFATDRGPDTDFKVLRFGNMRVALYHLDSDRIEVLGHMDRGKNINPQWAPDGKSLAFISDRTGISNIFLYDFADNNIYELTDVYTGVSGITPFSPCLSWARKADRLAFGYYEDADYNVYAVDNPRSLRRQPYRDSAVPRVLSMLPLAIQDPRPAPVAPTPGQQEHPATSTYRSPGGFRSSSETPPPADTGASAVAPPVSVRQLLDSATLSLPDTTTFAIHPYHTRFSTDFIAQPSIGYTRDNFGRGISGGTAISLSDMLGNRTLQFGGALNGRLSEAQFLAAYIDQSHRTNWVWAVNQTPSYFYVPSTVGLVTTQGAPAGSIFFTTRIRRLVVRDGFVAASHPFSRFNRIEFGFHVVGISDAILEQQVYFNSTGSSLGVSNTQTVLHPSIGWVAPTIALTHDNSLFGFVGPFAGSRYRFQVSPAIGGWKFTGALADVRRYFFARPFTLAFRGLFYGRVGRDASEFPVLLGNPDFVRGYTAGSLIRHECYQQVETIAPFIGGGGVGLTTGCADLDQLIGSRIGVANVELRFPLTRTVALGFLPIQLPPIEGAIFYDAGIAWESGSVIVARRSQGESPEIYRAPLQSWGASIRVNFIGIPLRFDYAKPLTRTYDKAYWTISIGPTF